MEIVNAPERVDLHSTSQAARSRAKAWKIAYDEHVGVKEHLYQSLPRSKVDRSQPGDVLKLTYAHVSEQVEGGIGALANKSFIIDYDVRANMDRQAVYEPEVGSMAFRVDWSLKDINVGLYSGELRDVVISGDLRRMVTDECVTNLTKFAELVGLNQKIVKEKSASQANDAIRAIGHLTNGQNKLTRLVKGCLLYLDHLGCGSVDYIFPQRNVLEYDMDNILDTLKSHDSAYVWTSNPALPAVNAVLYAMCLEYPNPIFRSSSHIKIPRDASNIYLVGQKLSATACNVTITADVIWGTLLTYANNLKLGNELESAMTIACSLRQNRYLREVRLPKVVSGVDMVQPILGAGVSNVVYKTVVNLEASMVLGRVHQMLCMILVKDVITSAENSSDFKKTGLDRKIQSLISRDSHTVLEYIEKLSVANVLKMTSGMRWLEIISKKGLEDIRNVSVLEGFWLIKNPKDVLKDGIIRSLKKGEKMTVSVNKIGVHVDTYSVFRKEILLAGGTPCDNMPNGFFHVSVSGLRHGRATTKLRTLGKEYIKNKCFYSEGIPVDGDVGGLLPCPPPVVSPSIPGFGISDEGLLVAPKKAADLSRMSAKGRDVGKDGEFVSKPPEIVVGDPNEQDMLFTSGIQTEPVREAEEEEEVEDSDDEDYQEGEVDEEHIFYNGEWYTAQELDERIEKHAEKLKRDMEMSRLLAEKLAKEAKEKEKEKEKSKDDGVRDDRGREDTQPRPPPPPPPPPSGQGGNASRGNSEGANQEKGSRESAGSGEKSKEGDGAGDTTSQEQAREKEKEKDKEASEGKGQEEQSNTEAGGSAEGSKEDPVIFQKLILDGKLVEWGNLNGEVEIFIDSVCVNAADYPEFMSRANAAIREQFRKEKEDREKGAQEAEERSREEIERPHTPRTPGGGGRVSVMPKRLDETKMPEIDALVPYIEFTQDYTKHTLNQLEHMSIPEFLYGNYRFSSVVDTYKYYLLSVPMHRMYHGKMGWFRQSEEWERLLLEYVGYYLGHDDVSKDAFPSLYWELILKIRRTIESKDDSAGYPHVSNDVLKEIERVGDPLHMEVMKNPHEWKPDPKKKYGFKDLCGIHKYMYNNKWWMSQIKDVFSSEKGVRPPTASEMAWAAEYLDAGGVPEQFHLVWKIANHDVVLMHRCDWSKVADQMKEICHDASKFKRKIEHKYSSMDQARDALMMGNTIILDPSAPWTKEEYNAVLYEVLGMGMGKKAVLLSSLLTTRTYITDPLYYVLAYKMLTIQAKPRNELITILDEHLRR